MWGTVAVNMCLKKANNYQQAQLHATWVLSYAMRKKLFLSLLKIVVSSFTWANNATNSACASRKKKKSKHMK